jgi:hypothetical protein
VATESTRGVDERGVVIEEIKQLEQTELFTLSSQPNWVSLVKASIVVTKIRSDTLRSWSVAKSNNQSRR